MPIISVFAEAAVADFNAALSWYEKLFGRPADNAPMDGLAEWYLTDYGGIQVFHDKGRAGKTSITLGVTSLDEQLAALEAAGITAGPIQGTPGMVKTTTITDEEGNQITFAEDLTESQ